MQLLFFLLDVDVNTGAMINNIFTVAVTAALPAALVSLIAMKKELGFKGAFFIAFFVNVVFLQFDNPSYYVLASIICGVIFFFLPAKPKEQKSEDEQPKTF